MFKDSLQHYSSFEASTQVLQKLHPLYWNLTKGGFSVRNWDEKYETVFESLKAGTTQSLILIAHAWSKKLREHVDTLQYAVKRALT